MFINGMKMEAIKLAKATLRKEISEVISRLKPEEKTKQSQAVFNKVVNLQEYQDGKRISIYLSTDDEINTVPLLKNMFDHKKQVFVPKYKGKTMHMVKLHSMEDYENLPLTKWNIKQPANDDNQRDDALETGGLDLIILPGVAFTMDGKRLGHGMGYYDKFLHKCIAGQSKKPYLIAVAFNEQIKSDIPTTETDVILDAIITEK